MSVQERTAFVLDIEQRLDAAIAAMTPDALINEQNIEVCVLSGYRATYKAAQASIKRVLQDALKKLKVAETRERCSFVEENGDRCINVVERKERCK